MASCCRLVLLLAVVSSMGGAARAISCRNDYSAGTFCRAVCRGNVVIDVSNVFEYPAITRGDYYKFVYNPCDGVNCLFKYDEPTDGRSTAICQMDYTAHVPQNYTCGRTDMTEWTLHQENPFIFSVVYYNSTGSRKTVVTYYEDPSYIHAQLIYKSQNPINHYNFEVRGRFVGQPPINCTVSKLNPCKADCNGRHLDISKVFNYPITAKGDYYNFVYNPCNGVDCFYNNAEQSIMAAMCQVDLSTSNLRNYTCGRMDLTTWTMQREDPYVFTVVYDSKGQTPIPRKTIITFYEKPSKTVTKLEYISQDPRYTYNFKVTGKFVGQP